MMLPHPFFTTGIACFGCLFFITSTVTFWNSFKNILIVIISTNFLQVDKKKRRFRLKTYISRKYRGPPMTQTIYDTLCLSDHILMTSKSCLLIAKHFWLRWTMKLMKKKKNTSEHLYPFALFEKKTPRQAIANPKTPLLSPKNWLKVKVFGSSPSPGAAWCCMKRTTQQGEQEHGSEARLFFGHWLCVDGDLTSITTSEEAIDLLAGMLGMLTEANLYLQKVSSNYSQVTEAFLAEIRVKDLLDLDRSLNPSLKAGVLQPLDVSLLHHTLVKLWDHLQDSGEIDCILGKKFKHLILVCWTRYTCESCRTLEIKEIWRPLI